MPEAAGTTRTQLRLGVVMTGGVSLCVWMGGTAFEIDRLRRGDGVYGSLARATGVDPVVDIIAGTSAGGLNGTLLGAAIAWGTTLDSLRDVWLTMADIEPLLHTASDKDIGSLLRGDGYFLPQIAGVLQTMSTSRSPGASAPAVIPATEADLTEADPGLHLIVTTTLMTPSVHTYPDATGQDLSVRSNLGLFVFHQGGGRDDFSDRTAAVGQLARAARSSASFPVAFEPSYARVDDGSAPSAFVNMASVADFVHSRYTMDGGVMDNQPIDHVLTQIAQQPATGLTRRVVLFVSPLAGTDTDPAATAPMPVPGVLTVLKDTLTLPREQSIVSQLESLTQRSRQHGVLQDARWDLFAGATTWEEARLSAAPLTVAAERLGPLVRDLRQLDVQENRLRAAVTGDLQQARQNLLTVQDLLRRSLILLPERLTIRTARARVSQALQAVSSGADGAGAAALAAAKAGMDVLVGLVSDLVVSMEPGVASDPARIVCEVLGIRALTTVDGDADSPVDAPQWATGLADLDTLQSVFTDGRTHNPQQIELVAVDANTPLPLQDDGSQPPAAEKLTGIALGHFGAFYLSSWRENDWTWGRLDGSFKLIEMLIDPERLLALNAAAPSAPRAAAAVVADCLVASTPGEVAAFITEATTYLEGVQSASATERPTKVQAARTFLASAVAADLHHDILVEELPILRQRVIADIADGAAPTAVTEVFLHGPTLDETSTRAQVKQAFLADRIGTSTIGTQLDSPRFLRVADKAAAVAIAVVRNVSTASWATVPLRLASWLLTFVRLLLMPVATSKIAVQIITVGNLIASVFLLAVTVRSASLEVLGLIGIAWWVGVLVVVSAKRQLAFAAVGFVLLGAGIALGVLGHHYRSFIEIVLGTIATALASIIAARGFQTKTPGPAPVLSPPPGGGRP